MDAERMRPGYWWSQKISLLTYCIQEALIFLQGFDQPGKNAAPLT